MSQLPLAEHQTTALDQRRRALARAGLEAEEVNREVLIPRLDALDWSPIMPESPDLSKLLGPLLVLDEPRNLTRERLFEWSRLGLGDEPVLRSSPATALCPAHSPVSSVLLEKKLERFFEWSTSPAFQDLQPILQLTLTQLRLFELLPFRRYSEALSFWFGVLPLVQGGYLVPLYSSENLAGFAEALNEGLQFDTSRLVGLNLDAVLRSYELAMDLAN